MNIDMTSTREEQLVALILTGFPLATQQAALLELVKRMGVNQHEIIKLSSMIKAGDDPVEVLTDNAKRKNRVIKDISAFLN